MSYNAKKDLLILQKNTLEKQKELRYKELENRGIPEPERTRAVEAEFVDYPTPTDIIPWPGPVTGVDLAGNINLDLIPASREPPIIQPNTDYTQPFPTPDRSPYGIGTTSQPYPSSPTPDIYPPLGSVSHTYDIKNPATASSENWIGTASDVNSEPSMHNEHGFNVTKSIPEWRYPIEDSQIDFGINIPPIIIEPSGQFNESIKSMQETIGKIREQATWLSNDYINRAKEAAAEMNGVLYLVRAATESITDHRSEGERYRRKLSSKELNSMARTATGKNMDINHNPDYATGGMIPDSEYDEDSKEIQMLVIETDPQINQYIADGSISAVSINGGNPRSQHIEPCSDNCSGPSCELCNVPKGVILGEADGIAMTWVVTDPRGIMWRGQNIPVATPGIKNTKIEIL